MKTQYKFLTFIQVDIENSNKKTMTFNCTNTKSKNSLGLVSWYSPWRQYCYMPSVQAVYSDGCLKDIADFIQQLMQDRKEQL